MKKLLIAIALISFFQFEAMAIEIKAIETEENFNFCERELIEELAKMNSKIGKPGNRLPRTIADEAFANAEAFVVRRRELYKGKMSCELGRVIEFLQENPMMVNLLNIVIENEEAKPKISYDE